MRFARLTLPVTFALAIFTGSTTSFAWDAMLTCRFEESRGYRIESGRVVHEDGHSEDESVFADLDSSTPTVRFSSGTPEHPGSVVRRDDTTVWLLFGASGDGIYIFTIFRDTKRIIVSLQGHPFGTLTAAIALGQCR